MPLADRLYITHVHRKAPADIYFPEIDLDVWKITEKEDFMTMAKMVSPIHILFTKEENAKKG